MQNNVVLLTKFFKCIEVGTAERFFHHSPKSSAVVDQAYLLIECELSLPLPYSAPKCNYCVKPAATTALKKS